MSEVVTAIDNIIAITFIKDTVSQKFDELIFFRNNSYYLETKTFKC